MRAIGIKEPGEPSVLTMVTCDPPLLRPHHVRVAVRATALNRADLLQRRGLYPPPPGESEILGLEVSGVVCELGEGVTAVTVGDEVCALLPGGGYAEEVVVHEDMLAHIPSGLTFEEAAALPEVFLTAYSNLVWLGQFQPGQSILIHAGASGVGTAAIQLVKQMNGNCMITAGSSQKRSFCKELGADRVFNYHDGSFVEAVLTFTNGRGVDIIFDFIGEPYFSQNLASLSFDGKLILIGTMGGSIAQNVDLGYLLRKRLQILGTALRSRSQEQKIALTRSFFSYATPLFERGVLRPIVDRVFDWRDAAAAHAYMETNQNIGKIVLTIGRGDENRP
ncbi:NAD(P)H-quinone oxidoreductase [Ferroacidibacillus organovorans]|uniref:NADPH:quinone oxidoreductase n=1 Tax=Ferroacidibacillus organovorans TaxID=1765683 RepID=A0A853KD62_9BACL|nr:NAD(P)H-quinone oxidoreductase [Ferroacidibacillus organovorans]KYP81012.1 NADPH:quinone oxidoreductase [Ferroacidibacillus organovorans]OAG94278.1 NADPH:quinone oxidoreductase [Ferroacidibacillus organovorans]